MIGTMCSLLAARRAYLIEYDVTKYGTVADKG